MPSFSGTSDEISIEYRMPIECTFPENPDSLTSRGPYDLKSLKNELDNHRFEGPAVVFIFRREDREDGGQDTYRERIVISYWDQDNHPSFESSPEAERRVPLEVALNYYIEKLVIDQSNASAYQQAGGRSINENIGRGPYSAAFEEFECNVPDVEKRVKGRLHVFSVGNDYFTIESYAEADKWQAYKDKFDITRDSIRVLPS